MGNLTIDLDIKKTLVSAIQHKTTRVRQDKISLPIHSMDVFNSSFRVIARLPGQKRYMKNVLKIK